MATRHFKGDSSIDYTDELGATVHFLLGDKLSELAPVDVHLRYDSWAADNIHREVVEIGDDPVYDLLGTLRFDDDPGGLKRMLRRGLAGATLNYRVTQAGIVYPVQLVAVMGASKKDDTPIERDRGRWRVGNWMTRIHIRRVDGFSLDSLLTGANTL